MEPGSYGFPFRNITNYPCVRVIAERECLKRKVTCREDMLQIRPGSIHTGLVANELGPVPQVPQTSCRGFLVTSPLPPLINAVIMTVANKPPPQ